MQDAAIRITKPPAFNIARGTVAGASASLVGIGLARFAYTPLLPAIIDAHWFAASTAAYLGAANLGGYLAGALLGGYLAKRANATHVLRAMMLLATIAFVACAFPLSFAWFFVWRFASGLSGGALMVLAAPTVLVHVPPSRRGLVSGAIFAGIGLGIAASGTLVPLLLLQGVKQTWLGLAAIALLLTLAAWNGWPKHDAHAQATPAHHAKHRKHSGFTLRALYAEYALNAIGLVPHMLFLVDFVSRGLGKGLDTGAQYWVLFGLGAIAGPLLSGHLADRAGFGPALRVAFVIQIVAVALLLIGTSPALLIVSSVLMGAAVPGIVPLALGRVNELLAHHPAAQKGAWSTATTGFAVLQAGAAYGMSFLFTQNGGNYRMLFAIGATALALALSVDLFAALRGDPENG
ncbi:Permeases of the major facilitator superfamily (plasmid) [Paraburkholderia caribensis MBA4]|uniref:Permeases of the major facilitator superfamily n=1 Tax=Paraburkholderia caribensis MBA4 TaxID=1323664 RepID=A0A0P0RLH9_9BURK|nr:YbfB/YjiJ family MFS transporter [Paraburkholderia caribensis]ALL69697.1 Permeases of the major facilitator superfamily [Paraburkholderia caribensis MBA4]